MNYYPNFKNYNYTNLYNDNLNNASYENVYVNTNDLNNKKENLYNPYEGFIRGNLFKNLYDSYKLKEPYEIKPINEQAQLLTYINSICFAMTDLNLYLDIYSNDKKMLNLYNEYRNEKEKLTREYEAKFGPISLNSESLSSYPWAWDNMPWPWDN